MAREACDMSKKTIKLQYKIFKGANFIRQSLAKTGRVKYVCPAKESDSDLNAMPDRAEFYKKASGLVGIWKKQVFTRGGLR